MHTKLAVGLAAALASLALAAPAGAANPQIAGLQVALRAYGLYSGPVDAIAGPQTRTAVRAFQQRQGLPVTGLADTPTRIALGSLGRPLFGSRVLRPGMFGMDVSVLQFLLARAGVWFGPIDGFLDAPTEQAVRRLQRRLGLAADGIVGPATLAVLRGRDVAVAPLAQKTPEHLTVVVRPGDTLSGLATRYGLTVGGLAGANGLDPRRPLPVGIRLVVPARTEAPVRDEVRAQLDATATRFGVDPHLVRALAWMESGFQPEVVSNAQAVGVLQVIPPTWRYVEQVLLGRPVPRTADGGIEVGVAYLAHLLRVFGGDESRALSAWFEGPAAEQRIGTFTETKAFVEDVLALKERL